MEITPSAARKRFDKNFKEVSRLRVLLADWQEMLPRLEQVATLELPPLASEHDAIQRKLVLLFERAHDHKSMGRRNREKLESLIWSIAAGLLDLGDDPELEQLVDKYGGLPDDPPAEWEDPTLLGNLVHPAAFRFLRRDWRRQWDEEVRSLYSQLAKALHPERASDAVTKVRNTELMHRVHGAHRRKDLLALLQVQLEFEQISAVVPDDVSEQRIDQFNRILQVQTGMLLSVRFAIENVVRDDWNLWDWSPFRKKTPKAVWQHVQKELDHIRRLIADGARDLAAFEDIAQLKTWLAAYQPPATDDDDW